MAGQVTGDESIEELMDLVAKLQKDVNWLMDGNLSSKNVREIGGYNVSQTLFRSREGDVGLSSANDAADPVRLWAGSADKDTAPWRVYKSGKSVMTGALIQSGAGYPKVVMDPAGSLFGAYLDPNRMVLVEALNGAFASPSITFSNPSLPLNAYMYLHEELMTFGIVSPNNIQISANGPDGLRLAGTRTVIGDWTKFVNESTWRSLQMDLDTKASVVALNTKATAGVSTGLSGGHNHGIEPGTQLMVVGGGSVTWQGAPQHSHAQV